MKPFLHIISVFCLFLGLLVMATGCRLTRHIEEGEHLVVKNVIHLSTGLEDEKDLEVDEDELQSLLRQKPNRRILGIVPFHITAWNVGNRWKKEGRTKDWLMNTVGEDPTLYREVLFNQSKSQVEKFMKNNGYFNARVEAVTIFDEKEVENHYYIYSGRAYRLRQLTFALEDTSLLELVSTKELNSKLNRGVRFDTDLFESERSRLTDWMKNHGYYTFDKVHVIFDIDTNVKGERYDVAVRLRNLRKNLQINERDTIVVEKHVQYRINEIYINPTFDLRLDAQINSDTVLHRGYTILFRGRTPIRPYRLTRSLKLQPGTLYSKTNTQYTYSRLRSLNNFRFIDIKYEPVLGDEPLLDARINLAMAPRQSITFEATGTNRSGNLGISGGVNYKNNNLLRGAEQFGLRVFGGLEAQRSVSVQQDQSSETGITSVSPFNTYELGAELRLDIPDFIFAKTTQSLPWVKEPTTSLSLTLDRQVRPDYLRDLINASYSVSMNIRPQDRLTISPIDLSLVNLEKEPEFEQRLQNTNNALLINSFNDHFIAAGRISYSYTTQDLNNDLKNYYYYRTNFELAGNLLRLGSSLFNHSNRVDSTDSYLINDIRFAQYSKLDFEFVYNSVLNESSRVLYRFYGGAGLPLKNLNTLPFDRSFYGGGSNGIRGWNIRSLGPGSTSDTIVYGIDQVGEMQLELNAEYRLSLTDVIEGALFMDVGNIWLLRYDPQRPDAEFSLKRIHKDLAIAPGLGVRLNFNFFVIRFDWGVQVHNPALADGERWIFQPKDKTNLYREQASARRVANDLNALPRYQGFQSTFNLAIGYPF